MFHRFFQFPNKVAVFILFAFFRFYSVINRDCKVHNSTSSLIFCWLLWNLVVWLRLSNPFVCQSPICVSLPRIDDGLCIYHLFVWSNLNFLHNSQWITLPTQLCLVLYSFCANLLHSLIMWLVDSSLSPHNPTFTVLLRPIYSRFDMIVYFYGIVLCCY